MGVCMCVCVCVSNDALFYFNTLILPVLMSTSVTSSHVLGISVQFCTILLREATVLLKQAH